MKYLAGLAWALVLGAGCASPKKAVPPAPTRITATNPVPVPAAAQSQPIITPDNSLVASILMCNSTGRFVVLNFTSSRLPKQGQVLFIYHNGLKTGELRINGPQRDNNAVADLTSGTAQVGDTVRDQ